MHKIECELTYAEWVLLTDILAHVGIDDEERDDFHSMKRKLGV